MQHTYYRQGLALGSLVELASRQSITLTGRVPDRNARSAPLTTNVALPALNFRQRPNTAGSGCNTVKWPADVQRPAGRGACFWAATRCPNGLAYSGAFLRPLNYPLLLSGLIN